MSVGCRSTRYRFTRSAEMRTPLPRWTGPPRALDAFAEYLRKDSAKWGEVAGLALVEEHDIVYREAPSRAERTPPPIAAPTGAVWRRDIHVNEVMLFRYSALIFVGHRIHYDRRYATEVEGYPGLVVHGPLIATLLADLLRRHSNAALKSFRFRAVTPLFDNAPFSVCGMPEPNGRANLWAQTAEGHLAMTAEAVMDST